MCVIIHTLNNKFTGSFASFSIIKQRYSVLIYALQLQPNRIFSSHLLPFSLILAYQRKSLVHALIWFSLLLCYVLFSSVEKKTNLLKKKFSYLWPNQLNVKKINHCEMASIFENVEIGPGIEVFALNKAYLDDTSPVKVNLGIGGKLFTSIYAQFLSSRPCIAF